MISGNAERMTRIGGIEGEGHIKGWMENRHGLALPQGSGQVDMERGLTVSQYCSRILFFFFLAEEARTDQWMEDIAFSPCLISRFPTGAWAVPDFRVLI